MEKNIETWSNNLGFNSILPVMKPFPVKDKQGMGSDVVMILILLDKGRYQDTLQFKFIRK